MHHDFTADRRWVRVNIIPWWQVGTLSYRTRRAQVIASSSLLHHDQSSWAADAAPNSDELVWANLG